MASNHFSPPEKAPKSLNCNNIDWERACQKCKEGSYCSQRPCKLGAEKEVKDGWKEKRNRSIRCF